MNKKNIKSLNYRKDKRTSKEFQKDLQRDTYYEKVAALMLKLNLQQEGKDVKVQNYGMDNSGELITDSDAVSAKADYLFIVDGQNHFYEIKVHSDRYPCMTFKVNNIHSYIKNKAECIVITESGYYVYDKNAMIYMVKHCPAKSYKGFAGGKEAYRLRKPQISALISASVVQYVKWTKEALEVPKKYGNIFEKRR